MARAFRRAMLCLSLEVTIFDVSKPIFETASEMRFYTLFKVNLLGLNEPFIRIPLYLCENL